MIKTTGFASPAQGYEEQGIDLNRLLIHNPPATYFFRLDTDEMENLGLPRGSLLIVDRSKNPAPKMHRHFVIIRHEGQFLCRLMCLTPSVQGAAGKPYFTNGAKEIYPVSGDTEIIGVVTALIKEFHQ